MSKAAELAALIGSGQAQTGRNLVDNGDFQIFQRATSTASITGEAYPAADRFKTNMSDAGTFTMSQSTTVPSGQGFGYSLKMDCTAADASVAAGSYMSIDHRIEASRLQKLSWGTSSAKNLTISFWVRSNLTGSFVLEFLHGETTVYNSNTYTIDAANTWEKKIITISGYTATAINNDDGIGLYIFWWLQTGSTYSSGTTTNDTWHTTQANRGAGLTVDLGTSTDNEFYLTGVQLEIGDVATPFEHSDHHTQLMRCRRYYQKLSGNSYFGGFVTYQGATSYYHQVIPQMRAAPTVTQYAVRNHSSGATANANANYSGIDGVNLPLDGAGGSDTHGSHINQSYIEMKAEL
jgi:hypothetical protein